MAEFRKTIGLALNESQRRRVSEMTGKIMLGILEKRHTINIAEQLKLEPWQVEHNIDETLYTLMKRVGRWRYFKMLFTK